MTIANDRQDNVCCHDLDVVDCADTIEHKHLVCRFSNAILSNDTIKKTCIGNHNQCIMKRSSL